MAEQWTRETPDRHEHVVVTEQPGYERRQEVIEDVATERYDTVSRLAQLAWLVFGILEAAIVLRIIFKLMAANPGNPFANLVYTFTDIFLWPFYGLTATPQLGGMVFELSSIIALVVYAVFAWVVVRLIWLLFYKQPTTSVTTYEHDDIR